MPTLLIHAWTVHKLGDEYYLPYTHWIYIKEIAKYNTEICLLSPVKENDQVSEQGLLPIKEIGTISVFSLPYSNGYVAAIPYFTSYLKAYKKLKNYDKVYVRYPVPFGWLSKIFFKDRIIHFVGDPMDAARTNPNFSRLKKAALISFFMPEHLAYMWACKGASVFTNGHHIKNRISRFGVNATVLISSTLQEKDFYLDAHNHITGDSLKLLYIGYLRKAKGVEVLIRALMQVHQKYPSATLTIAGSGEFEQELKAITAHLHLNDFVTFTGHIERREALNALLRSHDVFCFASLSEGSPRVILEAMANGLAVVSTPVGALPSLFKDNQELVFADFNNEKDFCEKIDLLVSDQDLLKTIRFNAFNKVKELRIERFIKTIFQ